MHKGGLEHILETCRALMGVTAVDLCVSKDAWAGAWCAQARFCRAVLQSGKMQARLINETAVSKPGPIRKRAMLGIPVCDPSGTVLGILVASQKAPRKWHGDDKTLLGVVARLIGNNHQPLVGPISEQPPEQGSKMALVAHMSHDIRSPINVILGMFEMIERAPVSAQLHEFAEIGKKSAFTLLRNLDDIIDLARIENGMIRINARPTHIETLIDQCRSRLETEIALNPNIEGARVVIQGSIPQCGLLDGDRFLQAITYLIENTVQGAERGKIALKFRWSKETEQLGIAIYHEAASPCDKSKPSKAKQAETDPALSQNSRRGLLIGLSVCKHLALLMGGRLQENPQGGSLYRMSVACPRGVMQPVAAARPTNATSPTAAI